MSKIRLATERKFDNLTPGDIEEGGGRHCGICAHNDAVVTSRRTCGRHCGICPQNVTVLMLKKGLGIEKGTGGTSNTAGPARAAGYPASPRK